MSKFEFKPARAPETGWSVWGQPRAVSELQLAVERGPAHSWIFAGPGGSGKNAAARSFAKALCCPDRGDSLAPCNECSVCRRIDRGVFPDVTEFSLVRQAERDADKSRNLTLNVATVREVSAAVAYRPSEAGWRIVIVRDAETMQETAQEAFLKTLEEPPAYAVLILLANELDPILPTIQSRCTVVRFGSAGSDAIVSALVAGGVELATARSLAALADGSMGWAYAAASDPNLVKLRKEEIDSASRFLNAGTYDRMVQSVRLADEFGKDRESVFRQLGWIQKTWRNQLYAELGLEVNSEVRGEPIDPLLVIKAIRSVDECIANLEANVRPRLALETMVLNWP